MTVQTPGQAIAALEGAFAAVGRAAGGDVGCRHVQLGEASIPDWSIWRVPPLRISGLWHVLRPPVSLPGFELPAAHGKQRIVTPSASSKLGTFAVRPVPPGLGGHPRGGERGATGPMTAAICPKVRHRGFCRAFAASAELRACWPQEEEPEVIGRKPCVFWWQYRRRACLRHRPGDGTGSSGIVRGSFQVPALPWPNPLLGPARWAARQEMRGWGADRYDWDMASRPATQTPFRSRRRPISDDNPASDDRVVCRRTGRAASTLCVATWRPRPKGRDRGCPYREIGQQRRCRSHSALRGAGRLRPA